MADDGMYRYRAAKEIVKNVDFPVLPTNRVGMPSNLDTCSPVVTEYKPLARPTADQDAEFLEKCMRAVEETGIERPKGYTVSYHMNPEMEKHHFGQTHPMKPWRLTLAKSLISSYGMTFAMDNYLTRAATFEELQDYHASDYLAYLASVMPEVTARLPKPKPKPKPRAKGGGRAAQAAQAAQAKATESQFNLGGSDCPLFEGLFDYCSMSAGGSLDAARKLVNLESDIAISWGGGLHHAKRSEASGFCYINDIVLAILELLRTTARVLYIDIDVHHGDGVEEAFFSTDRVMTCSFHKYDPYNFFPGTGALHDNGPKNEFNRGAHHSINVPLNDGITDEQYGKLFRDVVGRIVERFRPGAIALQCGADSLAGDRLGRFNLQVQGHGQCVEYCKSLGLPLLLFGGGGYTPRNVARAWSWETAIALQLTDRISRTIPAHAPWRSHFRQDELLPTLQQLIGDPKPNRNGPKKVADIVQHVTEQLRFVNHAPSVQSQVIPPDLGGIRAEVDEALREAREAGDDALRKVREAGLGK